MYTKYVCANRQEQTQRKKNNVQYEKRTKITNEDDELKK